MIYPQDEDGTADGPAMTIGLIRQDPQNAVYLPLPQEASPELLRAVSDAAFSFAKTKNAEMMDIRAGLIDPPNWEPGGGDAHEEAEADWLNAQDRFETAERRLGTPPEEINLRLGLPASFSLEDQSAQGLEADDLEARIAELAKMPGANDPLTAEAADLRQHLLKDAVATAATPEEGHKLDRMMGAARQDYAAHVGTLAAISLDASGQHDDAAALRQEAAARREVVETMRTPPDHTPPRGGLPPPEPAKDTEATSFQQDAEAAARVNGFGASASLVFMQSTTKETEAMQGTNPGIVFEEARASVAPGRNDYSVLQEPSGAPTSTNSVEGLVASLEGRIATPGVQQTESGFDEPSPSRPQPTQTRALGVGNAPGGSFLHEYNQDLLTPAQPSQAIEAEIAAPTQAEAAYESLTSFPAAVRAEIEGDRRGVQEPGAALESPGATIDTTARTVESAITAQAAEPTHDDPLQALTDMLSSYKRGIETEGGNEGNEAGGQEQAASAFRSFGR